MVSVLAWRGIRNGERSGINSRDLRGDFSILIKKCFMILNIIVLKIYSEKRFTTSEKFRVIVVLLVSLRPLLICI